MNTKRCYIKLFLLVEFVLYIFSISNSGLYASELNKIFTDSVDINFNVTDQWNNGFGWELKIHNHSSITFEKWRLNFETDNIKLTSWTEGWSQDSENPTKYSDTNLEGAMWWQNEMLEPDETIVVSGGSTAGYSENKPYFYEFFAKEYGILIEDNNEFDYKYAPYCDFTLNSTPEILDNFDLTGQKIFILAFIVTNSNGTPEPRWGGYDSYDLNYGKSIVDEIRSKGGEIMISIGGANGVPLSASSLSVSELVLQYKTIIDEYKLTHLDFDIEGNWVADHESILKRSQALALLQSDPDYKNVKIWYTLPILPQGLTQDGIFVINNALDNGVRLDGINVMLMDYGDSAAPPSISMSVHGINAANSLYSNIYDCYLNHNMNLNESEIWRKIGLTPMIGQNDVVSEVFTLSDAQALLNFAIEKKVGLLSCWSISRDRQKAGENPIDPNANAEYSGIIQNPFEFSSIFRAYDDSISTIKSNNELFDFELLQNYPNPFNPTTTIKYNLGISNYKSAKIIVYNSLGEEVWISKPLVKNLNYCNFDGAKFNSGIYYYSLIVDAKCLGSKKMILLK